MFNFTHDGLLEYINDYSKVFNIRMSLDYKNIVKKEIDTVDKYPIMVHIKRWWEIIYIFVEEYINYNYPNIIDEETKTFLQILANEYTDIMKDYVNYNYENLIDICTMFIFANIVHEIYSNPTTAKIFCNPFLLSSTWKENDSPNIVNHINYLSEQLKTNAIAYATSLQSKLLNSDFSYLAINEDEKKIFKNFQKNINNFINEFGKNEPLPILHPINIDCSIRF